VLLFDKRPHLLCFFVGQHHRPVPLHIAGSFKSLIADKFLYGDLVYIEHV